MPSVIVFDPETATALEMDAEDPTSINESGPSSVLVFDEPDTQDLLEPAGDPTGILALDPVQTDVWIGDPTPVTEVLEGEDLPDYVVVDDEGQELLVVSPQGPPGGRGPAGEPSTVPGPKGEPGDASQYDDMPDLTLLFENHLL